MAHAAKSIIAFNFRGDSVQKVTSVSHSKEKALRLNLQRDSRASITVTAVSLCKVHPVLPCEATASKSASSHRKGSFSPLSVQVFIWEFEEDSP